MGVTLGATVVRHAAYRLRLSCSVFRCLLRGFLHPNLLPVFFHSLLPARIHADLPCSQPELDEWDEWIGPDERRACRQHDGGRLVFLIGDRWPARKSTS